MPYDFDVSVRLTTFNHSRFIDNAIKGILKQKANFKINIVIGDDFSTDNTLEIISKYNSTPNKEINLLQRHEGDSYDQQRKKHGRIYNFTNTFQHCTGKYIALLDGDDYWLDEYKLQKQIDFLENNPEYFISFHNAELILADGSPTGDIYGNPKKYKTSYSHLELLQLGESIMPTGSIVYRRVNELKFPNWFYQIYAADFASILLMSKYGLSHYTNEAMSVYRLNDKGASSMNTNLTKVNTRIHLYNSLSEETNNKDEIQVIQEVINKFMIFGAIAQLLKSPIQFINQLIKRIKFNAYRVTSH